MAEFTQSGVISVLQAKTKDYVAYIVKAYSDTVRMMDDSQQAVKMISELSESAVLAGNSASKGKARAYINGIVPQNVWTELTEKCGYTDLLDKIKAQVPDAESVTTKHDLDLLLEEKLYPMIEATRQVRENEILKKREDEAKQKAAEAKKARLTAERNKKIKKFGFIAAIVVIVIAIASTIITKVNNAKAYQEMAGEFCVYRVINDDGEERDEFNWWLSIGEDGTMKMSSWSYAIDNCEVDSYSGSLKNKADFRKFEDYRIEDYCADAADYETAAYCYEFHVADEWDEFDGYIVCWQYQNGKIVDVYCDDYRYSFVETSDDYSFNKWEGEINSDKLSKNVQNLVKNIDVSEEDVINEVENLISSGNYDEAIEAIVASKLSDQQKNAYYDSLVKKIDFKSFDVNGLVINIPEHWYIEDYSDPYIRSARDSEEGSLLTWYIKCMGTIDQVVRDGDDGWRRDNDYSPTTVTGCEEAYIRRELSKKVDVDEIYSVIDYYVVCQGFVYKIQYFAYDERFFEPEMHILWDRVEFTNYAENRADIQEQKYLDAVDLLNNGKYAEAISAFEFISGYKDSTDKIIECITAIVVPQINESDYAGAYDVLTKYNSYSYAANMLKNFKWVPTESTYIPDKSSIGNTYHTYTYNDNGILIKETINDSTVITYSYDSLGNVILKKYTYSEGGTSQYEYKYNASNQLVQERYTYPDGNVDVINYTYDSNGRISEAEDIHWGNFNKRLTYSYDFAGKLIKKDTIDHFDSLGCYEYQYDEHGHLIKEIHTTDIGESYSVVYTTEYSYSTDGYLIAVYEYKDDKETGYEVFDEYIVFYSPEGFSN